MRLMWNIPGPLYLYTGPFSLCPAQFSLCPAPFFLYIPGCLFLAFAVPAMADYKISCVFTLEQRVFTLEQRVFVWFTREISTSDEGQVFALYVVTLRKMKINRELGEVSKHWYVYDYRYNRISWIGKSEE